MAKGAFKYDLTESWNDIFLATKNEVVELMPLNPSNQQTHMEANNNDDNFLMTKCQEKEDK